MKFRDISTNSRNVADALLQIACITRTYAGSAGSHDLVTDRPWINRYGGLKVSGLGATIARAVKADLPTYVTKIVTWLEDGGDSPPPDMLRINLFTGKVS